MSGAPGPGGLRQRWPYLTLSLVIVVLDQMTKALVDSMLNLHESVSLIDGLLSLTYVRNRGGAFGILSDARIPYQPVVFAVVGLLALTAMLIYAWRLPASRRLPQAALALVMGGAVGNLIDRTTLGYVIDYVDVYWGRHHWPAFNVADSAITVGVTLLILDTLLHPEPRKEDETDMTEAAPAPGAE